MPRAIFFDPCFSQTASLLPFGRRALWQNRMNWCFQTRFLACKIRETTQGVIRVKSLVGRVESCICTNLYVDILYICNIIYWYIMMYFIYCLFLLMYDMSTIYIHIYVYTVFLYIDVSMYMYTFLDAPLSQDAVGGGTFEYICIYTYIHRPLDYISKKTSWLRCNLKITFATKVDRSSKTCVSQKFWLPSRSMSGAIFQVLRKCSRGWFTKQTWL